MRQKYRIQLIDFITSFRKFPIGDTDKDGEQLHLADIVQDEKGEKHFIGYRYGEYMLKQPFTAHSIMVKDYKRYTRLNEVWGVSPGEWLIIGYNDDKLYESVKHIPELQLV